MSKVIAFVPARGGSKGIKLKNIKLLGGKPLLSWIVESLDKCDDVEQIIVATDCIKIVEVVEKFSSKKLRIYHRKPENATDESSTESVMMEFIDTESLEDDDILVLAQATSPFTKPYDFTKAINKFKQFGKPVLGVTVFNRFIWSSNGTPVNYNPKERPRRQDIKDPFLMENGSLYVNSTANIKKFGHRLGHQNNLVNFVEMEERTSIELDSLTDWLILEELARNEN